MNRLLFFFCLFLAACSQPCEENMKTKTLNWERMAESARLSADGDSLYFWNGMVWEYVSDNASNDAPLWLEYQNEQMGASGPTSVKGFLDWKTKMLLKQ